MPHAPLNLDEARRRLAAPAAPSSALPLLAASALLALSALALASAIILGPVWRTKDAPALAAAEARAERPPT